MKNFIHIKSITEVHDLFGFDKPRHPLVSVLPIDERMTNFDYGDGSYTFDFYQISLKEGIEGSLSYGRNAYDFQEGTMTFIKPGQIVKVDNSEDFKGGNGWTLLFHPDFIRRSALASIIDQFTFFDYDAHEALHLSNEEKKALTELVRKIEQEYKYTIDRHTQDLIIVNIEMLLKYCKRYYDRQFYTRTNLNQDIISRFEQVVRAYYQSGRPLQEGVLTVKHCAQALHISANYLGDLLKTETGRNAKDHIQDYVIEKAKTQILGTDQSMSEIAYGFGFEYPQGFYKLFKAKTGMSPSQYRNLN